LVKELFIKKKSAVGGRGGSPLSGKDVLRTRVEEGYSYAGVHTFWSKKLMKFTKYMVFSHGQGG